VKTGEDNRLYLLRSAIRNTAFRDTLISQRLTNTEV
jgi:hypothetical protein